MANYQQQESFGDSLIYEEGPTTLLDRLGYVKQLIFSRTRLEFRLLWSKIFQKEDDELGWLLDPYRQTTGRQAPTDATHLDSFHRNDLEASYQYDYDQVSGVYGRERVTIYNRGLAKKSDKRSRRRRHHEDNRSLGDKALEYARYMGMGVYITSTSFPSPFLPVNDAAIYDEKMFYEESGAHRHHNHYHNSYAMSKVW